MLLHLRGGFRVLCAHGRVCGREWGMAGLRDDAVVGRSRNSRFGRQRRASRGWEAIGMRVKTPQSYRDVAACGTECTHTTNI
jgi:hypothetical protein